MPPTNRWFLLTAGALTSGASLLHVGIIFGGADWYRFFGAGEEMARMATAGSWRPAVITAVIAALLAWGAACAFSAAGVVRRLPLTRPVLATFAGVFLARGVLGLPTVLLLDAPHLLELRARVTFMVVSSGFCVILGLCFALGLRTFAQDFRRSAPEVT